MPDSSTIDELPPLSDEDINILFNIVSLAQQSTHPPFRALFAAYDSVLADNGIAPEHDQLFFRYLLRLGEGPTTATNRDLLLRLRKLLARLDIHLLVNENDEDLTQALSEEDRIRTVVGQKRTRRASFNDTGLDETWLSGGRLETVEHRRSPQNSLDGLAQPERLNGHTNGGLLAPAPRGRVPSKPLPAARSRSLSTQGGMRIARNPSRERHFHPRSTIREDPEAVLSDSLSEAPSSPPAMRPSHIHPPESLDSYDEDMTFEADAFQHTTLIKTARQCIHRLHNESTRLQDLHRIAQNHDHRLLKAQAFSIWAAKILEKRQAAETDRFFDHYERRATRARDLFLLNKAFTHWAQTTSDEIEKTSVAQRHILRTRYFNAWKDITAVNELKCRRLGLRKWFSVWKANAARKNTESERAVVVYQEHLVQKIYWKWFWGFCERKAPAWRDYRVKTTCVKKLQDAVGKYRQHEAATQRLRHANLLRNTLEGLTSRWRRVNSINQSSTNHRRHVILGKCLHQLHQESKLGHASKQVTDAVSRKLLSRVFSIWQTSSRLSQQASAFNKQRTLQTAWRSWNDNLRSQALAARIDERVLLESLYKWTLQSRLALFKRVQDTRLQQRALQVLSSRLADKRFRLDEATLIFQERQRRRVLASVMLRFHGISRVEEMQERRAIEFRNAHALHKVWPGWRAQAQHLNKLDQWAVDARFYCLTTAALKKWRDAATQAKRNRRREAYITVRRRVKTSMVRNCFSIWRQRTQDVVQLNKHATSLAESKLLDLGISLFALWTSKTQTVLSLNVTSEVQNARFLFTHSVSILTTRGQEILQSDSQAAALRRQHSEVAAAEMLKKMKWNLFCLKRAQDSAIALEKRNTDQHRRNMLRYWSEQAQRRRFSKTLPLPSGPQHVGEDQSPTKPPATIPSAELFRSLRLGAATKTPASAISRTRNLGYEAKDDDAEFDFGATARAEEWTQFDVLKDFHVGGGQATPLPGYMRTPSRSARARRAKPFPGASTLPSDPQPTNGVQTNGLTNNNLVDIQEKDEMEGDGDVVSTTPATAAPLLGVDGATFTDNTEDDAAAVLRITPFERKMREGGYSSAGKGSFGGGGTTPATFRRTRFGRIDDGGSVARIGGSAAGGFGNGSSSGVRGSAASGGAPVTFSGFNTGRSVRFFDVGASGSTVDGEGGG